MTFWDTATTAQKLAQIEGGRNCGMNASQIATNCGAPCARDVRRFAYRHGIYFGGGGGDKIGATSLARAANTRKLTRVKIKVARDHTIPDDAFSIFGAANSNDEFLSEWGAF